MNIGDRVKIKSKLRSRWFGNTAPDITGTIVDVHQNGNARIEIEQNEQRREWLLPKQYLVVPIVQLEQQ